MKLDSDFSLWGLGFWSRLFYGLPPHSFKLHWPCRQLKICMSFLQAPPCPSVVRFWNLRLSLLNFLYLAYHFGLPESLGVLIIEHSVTSESLKYSRHLHPHLSWPPPHHSALHLQLGTWVLGRSGLYLSLSHRTYCSVTLPFFFILIPFNSFLFLTLRLTFPGLFHYWLS